MSDRINVRITCDPHLTEVVIVIGDGPEAVPIGIPVEQVQQLIDDAITARRLIMDQRQLAKGTPS
jgi:hypothetical protein